MRQFINPISRYFSSSMHPRRFSSSLFPSHLSFELLTDHVMELVIWTEGGGASGSIDYPFSLTTYKLNHLWPIPTSSISSFRWHIAQQGETIEKGKCLSIIWNFLFKKKLNCWKRVNKCWAEFESWVQSSFLERRNMCECIFSICQCGSCFLWGCSGRCSTFSSIWRIINFCRMTLGGLSSKDRYWSIPFQWIRKKKSVIKRIRVEPRHPDKRRKYRNSHSLIYFLLSPHFPALTSFLLTFAYWKSDTDSHFPYKSFSSFRRPTDTLFHSQKQAVRQDSVEIWWNSIRKWKGGLARYSMNKCKQKCPKASFFLVGKLYFKQNSNNASSKCSVVSRVYQ